ncbi:MAG: toll/interleukin-1 receptor domain-containing protein [Pseudanabaenales cyanobacterium]|nr:toll/interleukin-1 receptor domain-containing protein [Pseudanabaenales cyanobacterium]
MADIFISYSRRDKDFVETLYKALSRSKYDTWVDWEDIEPSTEWWNEIRAGIENSHTFIFIISPDSIGSKYCIDEAKYAYLHCKRIIPIMRKNCDNLPKFLTKIQWLSFQVEDDFKSSFKKLVETINTDLDHNKTHTWLELKAIEWLNQKKDRSLLLRKKLC